MITPVDGYQARIEEKTGSSLGDDDEVLRRLLLQKSQLAHWRLHSEMVVAAALSTIQKVVTLKVGVKYQKETCR